MSVAEPIRKIDFWNNGNSPYFELTASWTPFYAIAGTHEYPTKKARTQADFCRLVFRAFGTKGRFSLWIHYAFLMDKFFLSPCRMVQGFGSGRYKNMPLKLKKLGFLAAGIFKTRGRCGAPADQNRVAIVNGEKYSSKREIAAAELNSGKIGGCLWSIFPFDYCTKSSIKNEEEKNKTRGYLRRFWTHRFFLWPWPG